MVKHGILEKQDHVNMEVVQTQMMIGIVVNVYVIVEEYLVKGFNILLLLVRLDLGLGRTGIGILVIIIMIQDLLVAVKIQCGKMLVGK